MSFLAFIRFITENLGYTNRGEKIVKEYTNKEIQSLCSKYHVNTTDELINNAVQYSHIFLASRGR